MNEPLKTPFSEKDTERIKGSVVEGPNGCLYSTLRQGKIWLQGYPRSHRLALFLDCFGIPPAGDLWPSCKNPRCVAPLHMKTPEERHTPQKNTHNQLEKFGLTEWTTYSILRASVAGGTRDFACFSCSSRFDPISPLTKNSVLCNACSEGDNLVPIESPREKVGRVGISSNLYAPISKGGLQPLVDEWESSLPVVVEALVERHTAGLFLHELPSLGKGIRHD